MLGALLRYARAFPSRLADRVLLTSAVAVVFAALGVVAGYLSQNLDFGILALTATASLGGILLSGLLYASASVRYRLRLAYLLREPSASRLFARSCEVFLREFRRQRPFARSTDDILRDLIRLADRRRQPVELLLQDLAEMSVYWTSRGVDARQQMAAYLANAIAVRNLQFDRTVENAVHYIAGFLTDEIDNPHVILTYGYSSLVAEALSRTASRLKGSRELQVLVMEDAEYEQYESVTHAHREFARQFRERHVHFGFVQPHQIAELVARRTAQVQTADGRSFALKRGAQIELLLGCERLDPAGFALLPGRVGGARTSTTESLLDQRDRGSRERRRLRVVLLTESYKAHRVGAISRSTAIPVDSGFKIALFVGLGRWPSTHDAELILRPLSDFDVLISDVARFERPGDRRVSEMTDDWRAAVLPRALAGGGTLDRNVFRDIDAVAFGLDVLVESRLADLQALQTLLAPKLRLEEQLYDSLFDDRGDEIGLRELRDRESKIDFGALDDLVRQKRELVLERLDAGPLPARARALELLRELQRAAVRVVVLTAYDHSTAMHVLMKSGIHQFVDRVVSFQEDDKSAERSYRELREALMQPAKRCLVIDDADIVLSAAKRAGWRTHKISGDKSISTLLV